MKKLITEKSVEEFLETDSKEFHVDSNTLITPSAKDLARKRGIEFVYGENDNAGMCGKTDGDEKQKHKEACSKAKENSTLTEKERRDIVAAVIEVLKEKGILN